MQMNNKDEVAKACADSMYARDVAAQSLGIQIEEVRAGFARLNMRVRADMLNGHNICHGGFIFTLADTAFAYACNSYNRVSVAQNCDIDFLQAGRENDQLTALAEERQRGGRTGVYDVSIRRQDGELIAVFRGRACEIRGEVIQ